MRDEHDGQENLNTSKVKRVFERGKKRSDGDNRNKKPLPHTPGCLIARSDNISEKRNKRSFARKGVYGIRPLGSCVVENTYSAFGIVYTILVL